MRNLWLNIGSAAKNVQTPNLAFVEGDPVALENFLDLIASLLGTQERPIGRLS